MVTRARDHIVQGLMGRPASWDRSAGKVGSKSEELQKD
jgi:hypothetical protein